MILISIKPEHCKNIFNGSKTVEWRTKPLPRGRAAVYCTQSKLPDKRYLYTNSERVKINFGNFSKWSVKQNELSINDNTAYKFTCYLANGKVIGEFEVIRTLIYATVNDIPESVIMAGCVSKEFLRAYSKGKPLYANFIDNPQLYGEPKELEEFYSIKQCKPEYSPFGYQWTWEDRHKRNPGGRSKMYRPVPVECHRCKSLVGGKDYLDEKSGCVLFDYECTSNYHKPITAAPQSWRYIETPEWAKE